MPPTPTRCYDLFVGVDIAATSFTAHILPTPSPSDRPFTLQQTPAGFQALQDRLATTGVSPAHTLVQPSESSQGFHA